VEPPLAELQSVAARRERGTLRESDHQAYERVPRCAVRCSRGAEHELDKVVPISASVKTKLGRGGSDDEQVHSAADGRCEFVDGTATSNANLAGVFTPPR
jgi:hypothetical protein